MSDLGLKAEDIEDIANLYDQIRTIFKKKYPEADAVLAQAFEKTVSQIISDLNPKASQAVSSEDFIYDILLAKYKLWQMCGDKICAFIKTLDIGASKILVEIFSQQANLIRQSVTFATAEREKTKKALAELENNKKQTEDILIAAENLEQSLKEAKEENENLKSIQATKVDNGDEFEELNMQIAQLQEENERYLQKIIKLSKEKAENSITHRSSSNSPVKEVVKEKPKTAARPTPSVSQVRELSQRQLKEVIDELYVAKEKYDQKCIETRQPKETMEQFLWNYLNKKYGLKPLINDWYFAIQKALDKYQDADPEILLFSKILRHDLEESYQKVFIDVKQTTQQLLKLQFKNKFPYMREKELKDVVAEKQNGDLDEDEWQAIVTYMYNAQDSEYLLNMLKEHVERNGLKTKGAKPAMSYQEFVRLLLEFQVTGHDQLLEAFREKFRMFDEDKNGILSHKEFCEFLAMIGLFDESERLVAACDPQETGQVNFSDCVNLMLSEQIENQGQQLSVVYKLYLDKGSS